MYDVVLIECKDSNTVNRYGSYPTLGKAHMAVKEFNASQYKFKQGLNHNQLMEFVEEMPVIIKDYKSYMSVQWILAHQYVVNNRYKMRKARYGCTVRD